MRQAADKTHADASVAVVPSFRAVVHDHLGETSVSENIYIMILNNSEITVMK